MFYVCLNKLIFNNSKFYNNKSLCCLLWKRNINCIDQNSIPLISVREVIMKYPLSGHASHLHSCRRGDNQCFQWIVKFRMNEWIFHFRVSLRLSNDPSRLTATVVCSAFSVYFINDDPTVARWVLHYPLKDNWPSKKNYERKFILHKHLWDFRLLWTIACVR